MLHKDIEVVKGVYSSLMKINQIENLVLEGGAVKGYAHVGAIIALDKAGILKNIKKIAGSSIGSLIATAVALGFTSKELAEGILELNPWQLIDLPFTNTTATYPTAHLYSSFIGETYQVLKTIAEKVKTAYLFKGICSGKAIESVVQRIIRRKFPWRTTLTFAELHHLVLRQPQHFKDLYIPAVDILHRKLDVFSWETTPQMPIDIAVHCSMAFPLLYQAVFYNGKYYSDAGLYANLCSHIFDFPHHINHKTLCIALATSERINRIKQISEPRLYQSLSWFQFAKLFAMSPLDTQDAFHRTSNTLRTIFLNTEDVFHFNLFIHRDEIRRLTDQAENTANEFLRHRWQTLKCFILLLTLYRPKLLLCASAFFVTHISHDRCSTQSSIHTRRCC